MAPLTAMAMPSDTIERVTRPVPRSRKTLIHRIVYCDGEGAADDDGYGQGNQQRVAKGEGAEARAVYAQGGQRDGQEEERDVRAERHVVAVRDVCEAQDAVYQGDADGAERNHAAKQQPVDDLAGGSEKQHCAHCDYRNAPAEFAVRRRARANRHRLH